MKVTQFSNGFDQMVGSTGVSGGGGTGFSGDVSGFPAGTVTVVGIDGIPIDLTGLVDGDVLVYDSGSNTWIVGTASGGLIVQDIDGTPTVTATEIDVPNGSLAVVGTVATLHYVTSENGGLETLSTVGTSGSTQTLDLVDGNSFDITLTANCTFTFSGATSGKECFFDLRLRQDGTGSRLVTWPGSVTWASGSAPVLATAASALNLLGFSTVDGGANWLGVSGGPTSPLTTKGDLYGYSTVNARIPVGTDGYALLADSSQTLGVRWGTAYHEVVMVTSSVPPDPVLNSDGSDWVYSS
jgi:hypothetical protein